MKDQRKITVGILDRQFEVTGRLEGNFRGEGLAAFSGRFSARATTGRVALFDGAQREVVRSPSIRLSGQEGSTFSLFNVTVGNRFHWERKEDQTFGGDLILLCRREDTIAAINEIPVEDYLTSVISSEMSADAPIEFLKAHAILSRSWLLAALEGKEKRREFRSSAAKTTEGEVIRWYDREDHDLFDVCADDHCQRYHGMTRNASGQPEEAVLKTFGRVMTFQGEICDARYFKCCGGFTEDFATAWDEKQIPYLQTISDAPEPYPPIGTHEDDAGDWIYSNPEVYCNTQDEELLRTILPRVDRETKDFFRWIVEYRREELEEILRQKSGFDFGTLRRIIPLHRGPSGRISRLLIVGSKKNIAVGKELEIRRWLSPTHLKSSAFIVRMKSHPNGEVQRVILYGAGWGHGVGLCQIGAAVMATRGFSAEEILRHYFRGVEIRKIY